MLRLIRLTERQQLSISQYSAPDAFYVDILHDWRQLIELGCTSHMWMHSDSDSHSYGCRRSRRETARLTVHIRKFLTHKMPPKLHDYHKCYNK